MACRLRRGFTLIEVMIVVALVAILALIALPTYTDKIIRDQIAEALPLAEIVKQPVNVAWSRGQPLPADNATAGLPVPDKIVNTMVTSITLQDGAVHVVFGNRAHGLIKGKTLTLRPAVVEDAPVVPIAWICGKAPVPPKMTVRGTDRTDVPVAFLPIRCR
jgi:type IV pilus assembly protein PilA